MKKLVALFSIAVLTFSLFWSCAKKEQVIAVASVTISQPTAEMIIGETVTLKAVISPSNATERNVIWASSKLSVATVDQSGKVVAMAEGVSTITATADGKMGSCVVTVSKGYVAVTSVILDKTGTSLKVGETISLIATVMPKDATDKTVIWSTSDDSVATVSDGEVTAVKLGTATITARAGDQEASCAITVEPTSVASVTLDRDSANLQVGETITLTATVTPDDATDKTVTWSTSDDSVATVADGEVTAVNPGTATITVKANDGSDKSATCVVEVKQNVTGIVLDNTTLSLVAGKKYALGATVYPTNASDKTLKWSSANKSVATVNEDGVVKAVSKGKTTITATASDGSGIIAKCSVTVSSPCPAGAVDLGMKTPDGYILYWATCNVCETGFVSSPEEYGDYYAWGEVETYYSRLDPLTWKEGKLGYEWNTYKWATHLFGGLTRYNTKESYGLDGFVDNKTELSDYNYEDDVARQKLGGRWRIPTKEEWTELLDNCTWTWTDQNGVNGRLVTGPNGNSIFLPAAGHFYEYDHISAVGQAGSYWSSSLNPDGPTSAMYLPVSSSNSNVFRRLHPDYRPIGKTIRAVSD